LRELEYHGVIVRRPRSKAKGYEYWLTSAGHGFRPVLSALAQWGLVHARDHVRPSDLDPSILLWGFRKRARLAALPLQRVVIRFEFLSVPPAYRKHRILWLLLEHSGADVCAKDPGFPVDLVFRGKLTDFIAVYLGHADWREMQGKMINIEGDRGLARHAVDWLYLNKTVGRDPEAATPA
jgi:HxlR-like helix-turn-helix protein